MIDDAVDRLDDFAARFRVPIAVVGAAWFALTCADYAGFVDVPAFPLVTGMPGLALASVWNGIWWGVLYPRAEQRRAARLSEGKQNG